ncbi:MAG TPA: DNA polymerase IV, partial [Thermoanaerobaculia bacterium]|nr:DNA polymerase IV [Thermoanaerobaculia bacterium]
EAYLDVTEELTGIPTATETAQTIRRAIREETNLTASAGVAPNKFLAKIASDWKKPDGCFVIRPHQVLEFLEPLPVRKIPGVGKATEKLLVDICVATVGDLRRFEQAQLVEHFGKWGTRLWELARGIDDSPVIANQKRKSWSSENTFAKDKTLDEVEAYLRDEAQKLWSALAERQMVGRTVTVKLRTGSFKTATRRMTPEAPPSSAEELANIGAELLRRFDFGESARYRLAGIGISNFLEEEDEEPALFSTIPRP